MAERSKAIFTYLINKNNLEYNLLSVLILQDLNEFPLLNDLNLRIY